MNSATLKAHIGEKAILKMNGEYLKGEWEVELLGINSFNGKAKVMWKKPAMKAGERNGKSWEAKPADKKPEKHEVPLSALTLKDSPSVKKAVAKKSKKETTGKAKVAKKSGNKTDIAIKLAKAGLSADDIVKVLKELA